MYQEALCCAHNSAVAQAVQRDCGVYSLEVFKCCMDLSLHSVLCSWARRHCNQAAS